MDRTNNEKKPPYPTIEDWSKWDEFVKECEEYEKKYGKVEVDFRPPWRKKYPLTK